MKNYYQILGVEKTATASEIKKAYYKLSQKYHTDKTGDNNNDMQILINEAKEVLLDEEKRRLYDFAFEYTIGAERKSIQALINQCYRNDEKPYSDIFKQQYADLIHQLQTYGFNEPLSPVPLAWQFEYINTQPIYESARNIYGYMQMNRDAPFNQTTFIVIQTLANPGYKIAPFFAVKILLNFLHGLYNNAARERIISLLQGHLIQSANLPAHIQAFYKAIIGILAYEPLHFNGNLAGLIPHLEALTNYAYVEKSDTVCTLLWQDAFYNALFLNVMQDAWLNPPYHTSLALELKKFFDKTKTIEHLTFLIDDLMKSNNTTVTNKLMNAVAMLSVLNRLEKMYEETKPATSLAYAWRVLAYNLLDALPLFINNLEYATVVNLLIQAGLCFQLASEKTPDPFTKMADEAIAFYVYCKAIDLSFFISPELFLYASKHCLHYTLWFRYKTESQSNKISSFLEPLFAIASLLPIATMPQANVSCQTNMYPINSLLREYLSKIPLVSSLPGQQITPDRFANIIILLQQNLARHLPSPAQITDIIENKPNAPSPTTSFDYRMNV